MICRVTSPLSPPGPQLYCHLRTWSQAIPLSLSMRWSRVNTEHSIHRVLYTPSTLYTGYCIYRILHHLKIDCLPLPASLPALSGPCCTQFSTFPQLRVDQWIESRLPSHMPPRLPPPDSLPPDWPPSDQSPPILIDHGHQVHLQTRSMTAYKCILEFTRSRPPSASLCSL